MFTEIKNKLSKMNKPFNTNEICSTKGSYTEFKIGLPQYSVFQIWSERHTTHNGYFQGSCNKHLVAYADKICIYEDRLVAYIGSHEVCELTKNNFDKDSVSETRYDVVFKHLS